MKSVTLLAMTAALFGQAHIPGFRESRKSPPPPAREPRIDTRSERLVILDSMTNWQRNIAGRHCRGQFHKMPIDVLKAIAAAPYRGLVNTDDGLHLKQDFNVHA